MLTRVVAAVGNIGDIVLSACEVCSISDYGPSLSGSRLLEYRKSCLTACAMSTWNSRTWDLVIGEFQRLTQRGKDVKDALCGNAIKEDEVLMFDQKLFVLVCVEKFAVVQIGMQLCF